MVFGAQELQNIENPEENQGLRSSGASEY